jgi:hypothetical protein
MIIQPLGNVRQGSDCATDCLNNAKYFKPKECPLMVEE